MSKSTKIMLSVISAVLAVCIVITAIVSVTKRREIVSSGQTQTDSQSTTAANDTQQTEDSAQFSGSSSAESTDAAVSQSASISQQIIGKWTDSANMSGYEFKDGGFVTVTYVNLTVPVVNFPINGSANGTYTLNGNDLTINFSIYTKTITHNYTAYVENNTLTLVDKEDSDTSTYKRVSDSSVSSGSDSSQAASTENEGIYGSWQNSDGSVKYTFNKTGIVSLEFSSATVLGQKFTGKCDGVFIINGDKLTIQYTILSQQVTDEYTFSVSDNSMSLKDSHDKTTIFVRSGFSSSSSNESSLLGKWTDSSAMSGYEFKENGVVEVTYVNFTVPVINMPINGSYTGSYTTDGDNLTINVSIYSKAIAKNYTFSVNGNTLTLIDKEDSKTSTYTKQ